MTQLTAVFPDAISRGATGGPEWLTEIVETGGGYRYANAARSAPLHVYDVSHAAREEAYLAQVRGHFLVAHGRAHTFPFKDWLDYKCPDAIGTGIFAALSGSTFQFYKRYTIGSYTYDRKIVLPKNGTIVVTGGTLSSIDYTTGIATMSSGTPLSWVGEFYVLCRYGADSMPATIIDGPTGARIAGADGIKVEEDRT